MREILAFDTSSRWFYVSLLREESKSLKVVDLTTDKIPRESDDWLHDIIQEKLALFINDKPDVLAVGQGPGSFTGLRIAYTYARVLGMLWEIPVISFSSIQLWKSAFNVQENDVFIIPANKNLFYVLFPEHKLQTLTKEELKMTLNQNKQRAILWEANKKNILNLQNEFGADVFKIVEDPQTDKIKFPFLNLDILDHNKEQYKWENALPEYGHEPVFVEKKR
ncbi:MAG: tRNA (adenosine(37)-N6)-threonylcarbamoyltransferase complex dimerization subunit type 1 TsaB [Spirochaetia bacterium]|nr:tRNA (adenosine(37)-N6)-threonylcarbamoyltransferase complex dimerization subunit type 1 TsaB [Spirochaetia bacterium]